jgi:hypothetical protein
MTRFSGIDPRLARGILAAVLAFMGFGLVASFGMERWQIGWRGSEDLEFYRQVVESIRDGEGYYDALARIFPEAGFASHSVFHWRQPTLATLIAKSPDPEVWRWLLMASSLASVICAVRTFFPEGGRAFTAVATILLMGGAFAWNVYEPDSFLATEPWCEVLFLFSLCAYARGYWILGVAAAGAALALRELALPFCVAMAAIAIRQRNWKEVLTWSAIFVGYSIGFAWHSHEVIARQPIASPAAVEGWLHAPHLQFVLSSSVMNTFLRPLPPFLLAIYLPIALLGLAGWQGVIGLRFFLVAAAYIIAYSLCRGSGYWGYLYTSVLILGAIRSPLALRDLWNAAIAGKPGAAKDSP